MAKTGTKLKPGDFVHLHNHTQYSLLDGLTKVPALVKRVKELGMDSVAVTDHGTMSGAIEFYKEATSAGVKPIIGMEAYVAPRKHTDKDVTKDKQYYHLTVLAMNNQGYKNMMRLSSIANLEGYYYKPRIDHDLIKKYNEGLIVLSGCIGGEVSDALRQGQYDQAKKIAQWYKSIFGDRYYIELMDHGHPEHSAVWDEQKRVNEDLLKLSQELDISAVVTSDAHYLMHDDQEAHEILLCVQTGAYLSDKDRFSLKDFHLHVEDPLEIIKRWGNEHPQLIVNTKKIAERCDVSIELGKILIPKFSTPKGETEESFLAKLVWQGLAWRYAGKDRTEVAEYTIAESKKCLTSQVIERAEYELGIINSMGFNGYFLIIADFINWGKDRGIVFGPGRGSAAGSIVSYALNITELEPLKYDLLFERFLNPDRISMPDIDIDIQDTRRGEVIEYCINKYGKERVANIVTFGRMAARNSVRDVARVLEVPYAEADRLAKMIPPPVQGRHIPLQQSLKDNADLKEENNNQESNRIFDLATRLEGTIRSHGVHAAGVVIAPDDIVEFVPLEMAQKGVVATQYSMGPIEDLGLLKMDFLGLSNLTIIKNTLRIIKKVYNKDIDINTLPMDDQKTYKLLQRGETTGVFQLESSGMKRYLKDLKPTVFEDIIAMGALYRPGPLTAGLTDKFIDRKNGREKVAYDHKLMEPALKDTYGVMVYQEQFMQIVRDMCGFTGGESDTLRKAVGKKIRSMMAKMKDKIIEGAVKNGVDKKIAEKFWKDLEGFADYAFNKSHAACYGLISYQTAYLKANYPTAFMAALMTSDYDDTDRLAIEITECKKMGMEVLPPDIDQSFHEFAVVPGKNQIRFGLDAIKNIGQGAVEEIIRARDHLGGKFGSLEDYCANVDPGIVNRKNLESLIKAGAFDGYKDRSILINSIDNMLALAQKMQKDRRSGQVDLFGNGEVLTEMAPKLVLGKDNPAHPQSEQLVWERELLGLYLSRHPLEEYTQFLSDSAFPIGDLSDKMNDHVVSVGGSITAIRGITTKNGAKMAFVKLADLSGEIEMVIFPKTFERYGKSLERDQVVIAKGNLSNGRGASAGTDELKLLADEVVVITLEDLNANKHKKSNESLIPKLAPPKRNYRASHVKKEKTVTDIPKIKRLYIRLEDSSSQDPLIKLRKKLDDYKGDTEVVLVTGESENKQVIKLPQSIDVNETSLREVASIFGATNVVVK